MDIEQKQAEVIDYFVKQASNRKGASLSEIITEATSHSSLFGFSEILSVPNVAEVSHLVLHSPVCSCFCRVYYILEFRVVRVWLIDAPQK